MAVATGSALYHAIKNDATIWSAVRGNLYPNILPQNASYPAIVWGQLSDDTIPSKDGPIQNGYRFQVDVFATNYEGAQSIALPLKQKLLWYELEVPDLGYCRIAYQDQGDATYEDDKELIHIIQDFKIWVKRPA